MASNSIPFSFQTIQSIADLTDETLLELCEEPENLLDMTPLEIELIVRLGALLEVTSDTECELQAEVARLAAYEPRKVKQARSKATRSALMEIVAAAERKSKVSIQVAD